MSTIDLSQAPTSLVSRFISNTGLFSSPLIASAQTVSRQGLKWGFAYNYAPVHGDDRAELLGTLASLRGQDNRLRVPVYDNPKRGAYGGTPLVVGASQTGFSLNIDGLSNSVTNWIRKGDYFSVIVNGEPELKMATADASSSGTGTITISFVPRLRASPADNAVIYVDDGTLSVPKGIFLCEEPVISWTSKPGVNRAISSVTLSMIEDVFATQS